MTPNPPPSSDGSPLPPRHRPNLGNLAKDTTELDLWAFDDIQPLEDEELEKPVKPSGQAVPPARVPKKVAPEKRKPSGDGDPPSLDPAAKAAAESVKVNVGKSRPMTQSGSMPGQSKAGSDFDDLDHWEDVVTDVPGQPAPAAKAAPREESVAMPVPAPAPVAQPLPAEETPQPPPAVEDEFEAPVKETTSVPVSLRPRLGLSKVELIGMWALVAMLVVGGVVLYYSAIHRLPSGDQRVAETDFPIKGQHLSIESADSYWRAPIGTDTVRRDTVLIPEVVLKPSGGPAAIRVFFRNSDGDLVGDAVTRSIRTAAEIRVAATAGFEDIGMHAAYRTGQSKSWSVEVREAPSEDSPVQDFKKLFEMSISTDRR